MQQDIFLRFSDNNTRNTTLKQPSIISYKQTTTFLEPAGQLSRRKVTACPGKIPRKTCSEAVWKAPPRGREKVTSFLHFCCCYFKVPENLSQGLSQDCRHHLGQTLLPFCASSTETSRSCCHRVHQTTANLI